MVRKKRKAKPGDSRRAVAYIRVSTAEQRLGPKGQMRDLERWAEREGVEIVAVFVDHGVSGAVPFSSRPALLAAVAALQATGSGVLLAAKRDRLARAVDVAASIEAEASKAGGRVRTADGTSDATGSAGIISRGLHDLLGQWERAVIRERTTAALAVKRARGERVGQVPYGMKLASDGVALEPDPLEQAILVQIRNIHASGPVCARLWP